MSQSNERSIGDSQAWANSMVRPLSQRYLFVLASVAGLVVVDQAILQPLLIRLNFYAPVINLAGRQRMLSQKVTKEVLAIAAIADSAPRDERRDALRETLAQWTAAHQTLLHGDRQTGAQPVAAPAIAAALREIEPSFDRVRVAAGDLATNGPRMTADERQRAIATILREEPAYLRGMEDVVAMLQASSRRQVAWLRGCGLAAMTAVLLLLAGVYFAVLRPAADLIRGQVEQLATSDAHHRALAKLLREARDELELRVALRTSELSAANGALAREMAERQATEQRMRELAAQLAHTSRVAALGQLATGLAHEINQPLAALANYAGTLELALQSPRASDDRGRQLATEMKKAALRAGAIVRRMRDFARPSAARPAPVDLNGLVREVCELCRPEILHAGVDLTLDLAARATPVYADALQIQQVIVNLVQNAVQAMEASAIAERRLRIATSVGPDDVRLQVADSGTGFSCVDADKPFEPFYSTKPEGLGMGLAISRSIIQQYRGRIWKANRDGGGAVVGFCLPLDNAHANGQRQQAHCLCG